METVTLSLVAHTNVGKTTLARTLLRRDVGQVLDQAHVTVVTEAHEVVVTEGARLVLEDTPGFGDSARLKRRLGAEGNPIGWFLHQVWDRMRDKPMWCSQEAVRSVRERADVVLYLVNASESPEDAGYVQPEMEILAWVGRPVLLLLNQVGPGTDPAGERARGGLAHGRGALAPGEGGALPRRVLAMLGRGAGPVRAPGRPRPRGEGPDDARARRRVRGPVARDVPRQHGARGPRGARRDRIGYRSRAGRPARRSAGPWRASASGSRRRRGRRWATSSASTASTGGARRRSRRR